MNTSLHAPVPSILGELAALLGPEHVITDPEEREFYSTDVYRAGKLPLCVVRPGTREDVGAIVARARAHGLAVVPRGGGASYTDGYAPTESDSILIDTLRLDRIVEINERDMYVIAEVGVTWARLHEALKARGLRTPFFGPFSGLAATLGGSLSQNTVSWGSGIHGVSGETTLGVEVVLGTGEFVRTGTWGAAASVPFLRSYGPDLTGLFMGDNGAFGVKTAVALRLVRRPTHLLGLSFAFRDFERMAGGMEAAAKEGLCLINFGLDPRLQQGQLGKTSLSSGLEAATQVFRNARGVFDGLGQVLRIGLAGRRFLKGAVFSAHWLVEGIDSAAARSAAGRLRDVIQPFGAEVAATLPTVAGAMPFMPLGNVRGPKGERWVPVHGLLPFSRVLDFRRDLTAFLDGHAAAMARVHLDSGAMFSTVGTTAFLYEPAFYWHDVQTINHRRLVPPEILGTLPRYPDNPEGRALMEEIKQGIAALFRRHGAAHLQIGKFYPFLASRDPANAALLRDLKRLVDPERRMNPGALGL